MAKAITTKESPKSLARAKGRAVATEAADPTGPILLEYESPTAALISQKVPARSRFVIWVLATLLLVVLVLAGTLPIDRVVTTTGKIVSTTSNIVVQPLEVSIVRSIDVQEGQIVHAGDLLARLDPTFAAADSTAYEAQAQSLQAEVNRLTAESEGKPYLTDGTEASNLQAVIYAQRHAEHALHLENYNQKIQSGLAKVKSSASDISLLTQRLTAAKAIEDMRSQLEHDQVGSKLNTLGARDSRLEIQRNLESARNALEGSEKDLAALVAERDSFVQKDEGDTNQQLTEQRRKLTEMRDNANKAKLRRDLVELRAEHDAIVLSIAPVSVGSVMQSGDQFITMVPIDAPLEVETVLDARDAGFVRVGDPVTVKFDTFPYYTYGTAAGVVRMISPDSFRNPQEDRQHVQKTRSEEAFGTLFYRTRLSIDEMKLHDLPPGFRVTPGMPVTGDIKIGKRTMLQYLLSRAIPATTEGMREP